MRSLLLAAVALLCAAAAPTPAYAYRAEIFRIHDRDSVRANIDLGFGVWLRNQPLRLDDTDASAIRGEERVQGIAARDRLRELPTGCAQ